jgi:hypothetical protein
MVGGEDKAQKKLYEMPDPTIREGSDTEIERAPKLKDRNAGW